MEIQHSGQRSPVWYHELFWSLVLRSNVGQPRLNPYWSQATSALRDSLTLKPHWTIKDSVRVAG
jgi:hypothetical protein